MVTTDDAEQAANILEEGTRAEQKETLESLTERSHVQPEVLTPLWTLSARSPMMRTGTFDPMSL
jgi:hypothetical protein